MVGEGHIIQAIHNKAFQEGDRLVEFGTDAFVTTGTSVEVSTNLSGTADCVLLTYNQASGAAAANGPLTSDGVVTTNAITVARVAGTTSAIAFWYMFIGRRYD